MPGPRVFLAQERGNIRIGVGRVFGVLHVPAQARKEGLCKKLLGKQGRHQVFKRLLPLFPVCFYPVPVPAVYAVMRYLMHVSDEKSIWGKVFIYRNTIGFAGARAKVACFCYPGGAQFKLKGQLLPKRHAIGNRSRGHVLVQDFAKLFWSDTEWIMA